jgi:RimJ/RimL family protein N-acetyltransferase
VEIETERLLIAPIGPDDRPEELLPVFNSNTDYLEAAEDKERYQLDDVELYLWQETMRENSRCLAIRLRETGELVGTACLLVPRPREPVLWIGLLLLRRDQQCRGLGAEAAAAIEAALAAEGWNEVHLAVLTSRPEARRFWELQGYLAYDERRSNNKKLCWVMRKELR